MTLTPIERFNLYFTVREAYKSGWLGDLPLDFVTRAYINLVHKGNGVRSLLHEIPAWPMRGPSPRIRALTRAMQLVKKNNPGI